MKKKARLKKINIDDLPKFSNWPKILIDSRTVVVHPKNYDEIQREYDRDKWGALYDKVKYSDFTIDDLDRMDFGDKKEIACSIGGEIFLMDPLDAKRYLVRCIANELEIVFEPEGSIVEFGAGMGTIISRIASDVRFNKAVNFIASDFSVKSLDLITLIASRYQLNISTINCDLNLINDFSLIPENSVVYFSYVLALVKNLDIHFWQKLKQRHPKAVIIIEPLYDFYDESSILGMMQRRYLTANDYNINIYKTILQARSENIFSIQKINKNIIGINPFCPVSMLVLR